MRHGVVHLDTGRQWRGGQRQVWLLHRLLLARDIPSVVATPHGSELAARCRHEGLPVRELPGRRPWRPGVVGAVRRLATTADLVHAHDSHGAALAVAGTLAGRVAPVVCHRRAGWAMRDGALHRLKYRPVQRWIAVTEAIAAELVRWGVPEDRVDTVPSAVDVEAIRRRAAVADPVALCHRLSLAGDQRMVLATAALDPQKGLGVLVEAVATARRRRPELVLVVAGDGPQTDALAALAVELEVPARWLGQTDDVPELVVAAAVCVVPSLTAEGSSAALKEPLALGRPLVASDLDGVREVVGDAALRVPPGDAGALADAIVATVADPAAAERRVAAGLARVERFRPEAMVEGVLASYRRVMEERR